MAVELVDLKAFGRAIMICDRCGWEKTYPLGQLAGLSAATVMARCREAVARSQSEGWGINRTVSSLHSSRCPGCMLIDSQGKASVRRAPAATSPAEPDRKEPPERPKRKEKSAREERRMARTPVKGKVLAGASDQPPREPTREQKREIIGLLMEVYDCEAGRYRGGETDKTVADTIGGGVLPGWVAAEREDNFGPDGGSDEMEALRAELAGWRAMAEKLQADCATRLDEVQQLAAQVAAMARRLDGIAVAVGPKARG